MIGLFTCLERMVELYHVRRTDVYGVLTYVPCKLGYVRVRVRDTCTVVMDSSNEF